MSMFIKDLDYPEFRRKIAKLCHERFPDRDRYGIRTNMGPFSSSFLGLYVDATPKQLSSLLPEAEVDRLIVVTRTEETTSALAREEYWVMNVDDLAHEHRRRLGVFWTWIVSILSALLVAGVYFGALAWSDSIDRAVVTAKAQKEAADIQKGQDCAASYEAYRTDEEALRKVLRGIALVVDCGRSL